MVNFRRFVLGVACIGIFYHAVIRLIDMQVSCIFTEHRFLKGELTIKRPMKNIISRWMTLLEFGLMTFMYIYKNFSE